MWEKEGKTTPLIIIIVIIIVTIIIMMIIIIIIMIIIVMIIIVIIIIIIITFKGAIRDFFYNLLTAQRTVSNTYVQVAWVQSCPNHMQHI